MSRRHATRLLSRRRVHYPSFPREYHRCTPRARLSQRIPWINQRAPDTGLPAEEKPGCQACSRVRELRDAGSAVDLSRERVRRQQFVQPDVRSFLGDRRESCANVTSSLEASLLTFKYIDFFCQRKKFRLLILP